MRQITDHVVEGDSVNHQLKIEVLDEPGAGGANHVYRISQPRESYPDGGVIEEHTISFQNGPIKQVGVNGLTHEALIAIVMDRMRAFQSGPFACADNEHALTYLALALDALQSRTKARIARGVEGTHEK